ALVGGQRTITTRYGMWGDRWLDTVQSNTVYRAPVPATFRRLYAHSTNTADRSVVQVCAGPTNPPPCSASLSCTMTTSTDGSRCANTFSTIAVNAGDYFQIKIGPQANSSSGTIRAAFEIVGP